MNKQTLRTLGALCVAVGVIVGTGLTLVGHNTAGPDGTRIIGQSPAQFQPDVSPAFDSEAGSISVTTNTTGKQILVDTGHANEISAASLQPLAEATFTAGHSLDFGNTTTENESIPYNRTLQQYDGVLIIQPTEGFSAEEIRALRAYTDAGGRVVVLAEPTQPRGGGLFGPSLLTYAGNNVTGEYGVRMGAETLYNVNDSENDNNFKSIYATPRERSLLSAGVDTVSFDGSGYVALRNASNATVVYSTDADTQTTDTHRDGPHPVVVRATNLTFVADTSFLLPSELYDVDNEIFAGNLIEFLVSGDLDTNYAYTVTVGTPEMTITPTSGHNTTNNSDKTK